MLKALKCEERRESLLSISDEEKQKRIRKLRQLALGNDTHVFALEIFIARIVKLKHLMLHFHIKR